MRSEGIIRQLKLEQVFTSVLLNEDPMVLQTIKEMNQNAPGSLGEFIKRYAEMNINTADDETTNLIALCKTIQKLLERQHNYSTFMERLFNSPLIPEELKWAFLSSLQHKAKLQPADILDNIDSHVKDVIKKTEDFLYSKTMKQQYSMEKLLDADDEKLRKLVDAKIGSTAEHTGIYDINALETIIDEELSESFQDEDKIYILFDIETVSSEARQGKVFDISYKIKGDTKSNTLNVKLSPDVDSIPSEEILNTFFKYRKDAPKTYEEKYIQFMKEHSAGLTEAEALQNFVDYINNLKAKNPFKQVVLVGHNSKKFDIPYLKTRMSVLGMSPILISELNKVKHIDTLELYKIKNGHVLIDDNQTKVLTDLFTQFVTDQTNTISKQGIKKLDRKTLYKLRQNHMFTPMLISPSNGELASNIMQLSKEAHKILNSKTLIKATDANRYQHLKVLTIIRDEANRMANTMWENLRSIKSQNDSLANVLLDDDLFKDGTYLDSMQKFIEKQYTGAEKDRLLELYGSYLNASKLLYGTSDGGLWIGYRNVIDFGNINNWFSITKEALPFNTAANYTRVGKTLNRISKSIKRMPLLKGYAEEINKAISTLVESKFVKLYETLNFHTVDDLASTFNKVAVRFEDLDDATKELLDATEFEDVISRETLLGMLQNIRTDKKDVVSNFALLKLIYSNLMNNGMTFDDLGIKLSDKVLEYLEDTSILTTIKFEEVVIEPSEEAINRALEFTLDKDNYTPAFALEGIIKDLEEFCDFEKMAQGLDANNLFRARTQVMNSLTRPIIKIANDFEKYLKSLDKESKIKFIFKLKESTNTAFIHKTEQIMNLAEEDLYRMLVTNQPLMIVPTSYVRQVYTNDYFETIVQGDYTFYILKDADKVTHTIDQETGEIIYTHLGKTIAKPVLNELDLKSIYSDLDEKLINGMLEAKEQINKISKLDSVGTLGDVLTSSDIDSIYAQLPEVIKKKLPSLNVLRDMPNGTALNFMVLGDVHSVRKFLEYTATNPYSLFMRYQRSYAAQMQTKLQYINFYFDSGLDINTGAIADSKYNQILADQFKQNPEFILCALVEDKKYGCKVVRLKTDTAEHIALARSLNPIILPFNTYSKMVNVVNHDIMSSGVLKYWNRLIYLYKMGYLFAPGVFLRNMFDSTVKNLFSTDSSVSEIAGKQLSAFQLIRNYNEIVKTIINLDPNKMFTSAGLQKYFELNPQGLRGMDMDVFLFIDAFIKDGPSAGMTKAWADYYMDRDNLRTAWGDVVATSSFLMSLNTQIEQINRLSEYLILLEKGQTSSKAFYKIASTHFDYNLKTNAERYTELLMPFYTFTMRNLEYWIDIVKEKPHVATMLNDFMTPVWNFDSYSYDEYSRNRSLQYQILSGNVPLYPEGLTLKLSPSFMDAANLLTNPVEGVQNKVFTPFTEIYKYVTNQEGAASDLGTLITKNLPIVGTALSRYGDQASKYYDRTGNILTKILPDTFGATQRWQPLPKKTYRRYAKKKYNNTHLIFNHSKGKRYNKYITTRSYFSPYYPGRDFTPKRHWSPLMKGMPRAYNVNANTSKLYSNSSFYKKHYTTKGNSRMKARMIPVNSYTLKYRIKDFSRYK